MTILELANQLKEIYDLRGNIEVMFEDPNSGAGPFAIGNATLRVAEENEFPKSWNMPEGFQFVVLEN